MCPVGIPGIDVTSWNACESGIYSWSLNLTFCLSTFFSLKELKSNLDFISLETASDSDFFTLGI